VVQVVVQVQVVVVALVRLELLAVNHFQLQITQLLSGAVVPLKQELTREETLAALHQSIV